MTSEQLYRTWIAAIRSDANAADSKLDGIIDHIQRHAGPHLQSYVDDHKDLRLWAAGMFNLLYIFEQVALGGRAVTIDEMLDRLYNKSVNDPLHTTPCPVEPPMSKLDMSCNSPLVYERVVIAAKARCEGFDLAINELMEMATEAFKKHDDVLANRCRDIARALNISKKKQELGDALLQANKERDEAINC
jgi:hypothetical protein